MPETELEANEKYQRLHKLALSLYNSNQYASALDIWQRIQRENPDFPDIPGWIAEATKKKKRLDAEAKNRQPGRQVYRDQLTLARNSGSSISHSARFQPKPVRLMPRRIRHRHVAYALIVLLMTVFWASLYNLREFLLVLNPETGEVTCYKGTFFPYGWVKENTLDIGLEPGWEDNLDDPEWSNDLLNGVRLHGTKKLDAYILKIYRTLGRKALQIKTIEKQEEAIYYFNRIEQADYRENIAWDMATAYFNLAKLTFEHTGNRKMTLRYLATARKYVPTYPNINTFEKKISG